MTNVFYLWFLEFGFLKIWRGDLVVKNLLFNTGDVGWIPGSGGSLGEGNGNSLQYSFFFFLCSLQYSCLENPMDRGAWWATIHGVSRVGYDCVIEHRHRHVSSKTLMCFLIYIPNDQGLTVWHCRKFFFFYFTEFPVHPLVQCSKVITPIKISLFRDCNGPSSLGS